MKNIGVFCWLILLFCAACASKNQIKPNSEIPRRVIWAWERPEDLRFLDAREFAVAFLAQTLILEGDDVDFRPRRQPLEASPDQYLIAVTRVETRKESARRATFSPAQQQSVVDLVKKTLELPRVRAVQIDFDAVVSERDFYRRLIVALRNELPAGTPLTMTALASWCAGDDWFKDFPVDEAVPMIFEMGADAERVRSFLAKGNDWREPLCRGSYGLSVEEPLAVDWKPGRRFYFFKSKAWTASDLEKIKR